MVRVSLLHSIGKRFKSMTGLNKNPEVLHNPYFTQKEGSKDIWSLINETAAAAEKEGKTGIVNLGQGFFSYNPPNFALDAVKESLNTWSNNQYASPRGNPKLLTELSKFYTKAFSREVTPEEIQVTTGANEGMLSVFFGFLKPGDEVIVFQPFFDQYIPNIEMCGAKVRYIDLKFPRKFNTESVVGDDWEIDWAGLEGSINNNTKLIVINTPHNPIGKVFNEEELYRIGKLAIENNLILVSDEVYENLYYNDKFTRPATLSTLPELADRTFTVGSAGKSFAATGWRVGWVHGPKNLLKYVTAAHIRICFSSPAPLQEAVAVALRETSSNEYFEETRIEYKKKYEIFTSVFEELGLPYAKAEGGYFLLVNLSKIKIPDDYPFPKDISCRGTKDFKLAYWLIKEIGVVGIPPTEFLNPESRVGSELEVCLRFAVCKGDDVLQDAVEKLRKLKDYI